MAAEDRAWSAIGDWRDGRGAGDGRLGGARGAQRISVFDGSPVSDKRLRVVREKRTCIAT